MADKRKKLHLGCELNTPDGWINIDSSLTVILAKHPIIKNVLIQIGAISPKKKIIPWRKNILIRDVRKQLPFADNSIDAIYASHLLEHLYHNEAEKLLRECFRVLSPGGVLRLMVPDLQTLVSQYLKQKQNNNKENGCAADVFVESLLLKLPIASTGNWMYNIYNALTDFHTHKWMYDAESLIGCLQKAGFVEVSKKSRYESRIEDIKIIELNQGLCVEGVKP